MVQVQGQTAGAPVAAPLPTTVPGNTPWLQDVSRWEGLPTVADVQDAALQQQVQHALDHKTKPLGALGRMEGLALQIAMILRNPQPVLEAPQVLVCAADHGLAKQGVSAYPVEVTRQMVHNFLGYGAAVSVLARQHGMAQTVVDCGVAADFEPQAELVIAKVPGVEHGTNDASVEPAMTEAQCWRAIAHGRAIVAQRPGNAVLLGEMGIGNTSPASLIMSALTGHALADCVGRGTGLTPEGVARKLQVLRRVQARHAQAVEPLQVLACMGGLEIATLCGMALQAASERRVIVVDGFITTAAVAAAIALVPQVRGYCVFAHGSAESGHGRWLAHMQAQPLLQLDLRVGEGSGAALAWPLLESACCLLRNMASFEAAGVSDHDTAVDLARP